MRWTAHLEPKRLPISIVLRERDMTAMSQTPSSALQKRTHKTVAYDEALGKDTKASDSSLIVVNWLRAQVNKFREREKHFTSLVDGFTKDNEDLTSKMENMEHQLHQKSQDLERLTSENEEPRKHAGTAKLRQKITKLNQDHSKLQTDHNALRLQN